MIPHLSPSGKSTWEQCGRKFWFHYVEGLPGDPPSVETVVGHIVHGALELVFDPLGGPMDLKDAARQAWEASADEIEALGDVDHLAMKRQVWQTLTRFYAEWFGIDVYRVEMELRYELPTNEGRTAVFYGFVDLIERFRDGLYVVDAKTGKIPTDDHYGAKKVREKMDQPALYAKGVEVVTGEKVIGYALHYCHGGEFVRFSAKATTGAVSRFTKAWDEIASFMEDDEIPDPDPGPLCGWCPYVDRCEPGQREVEKRWSLNKSVGPAKDRLGLS